MSSSTPQAEELLYYLATSRVLICKKCHYAIQPSAISRHLKVLHHIYRSDRGQLVEYSKNLDLAKPADVVFPEPHEAPIPFLPTEDGLACMVTGCGHLCASMKRMKNHWATMHRDLVLELHELQWRPVKLQTFFRGNQLRYFIVSESNEPPPPPQTKPELDSESASGETEQLGTPLTAYPGWSVDDLDLLEHFRNSTYFYMGHRSESRGLWQNAVPPLAFEHKFLKHGLLSISALHRASQNPSEKQRYQMVAAWHQNQALPEFRSEIANPTKNNSHALLAYSQLLIIHCFASEEHDENLLLVKGVHQSGLPDWLQLIRGSCSVFENILRLISDEGLRTLTDEMKRGFLGSQLDNPETCRRLAHLAEIPTFRVLPKPTKEPGGTKFPLQCALLDLSRAFSKAHGAQSCSNFTIWTAVYIWPALVSTEYLDLLAQREPTALILLAHYCILLKPLETHWYMYGFTKRLLTRIVNQLDPKWRQWLQWPLDEIGLQE